MAQEEDENTLTEILEENTTIDIAKYINFVHSPHCGSISTFSGTTRDTFDGRNVVELRYEAYVPMAIRQIKAICEVARSTWSLHSIAIVHRLGPVPVGEISVFIAVSSVHRVDGLDACKFMIDEVKASVPIWKKEVYDNGEVWKENREFLERKDGIIVGIGRNGKMCCGSKVKEEAKESKGCCGKKLKEEAEDSKDCCGRKVRREMEERKVSFGRRVEEEVVESEGSKSCSADKVRMNADGGSRSRSCSVDKVKMNTDEAAGSC